MTAEHDKKRTAQHVDRLMARLKAAERERDSLRAGKQRLIDSIREELDEGLRLRELGGAGPDENITAMTERVIRERDALAQRGEPAAWLPPICRYISDVLASDAAPSEKHIARTIMHLLPLDHEPVAQIPDEATLPMLKAYGDALQAGCELDGATVWRVMLAAARGVEPCSCDQRGIGVPGVTCGDCPRDYWSKA